MSFAAFQFCPAIAMTGDCVCANNNRNNNANLQQAGD